MGTAAVQLLLVEDSMAQAKFIQLTLRESSSPTFEVAWVESLAGALLHLAATPVDLVLLDLVLPDCDGFDTFLAVHRAWPEIPVIVLSGAGDEGTALRSVSEGAQDYLAKSTLSPELLTRSIRYALDRHRNLVEFRRLALWDDLTGVRNRRGFLSLAEQQIVAARRASTSITVLFVDVDGLKQVNDTHGHRMGDRALADVAALMQATLRASDVIGRVGGDEFCAVLLDDDADASPAAARLTAAISVHNATGTHPFELSCTVGTVTREPSAGLTVDDLLSQADEDMYNNRQLRRRLDVHPVSGETAQRYSEERTPS